MAEKQLIVVLEGTDAMGPCWQWILTDYLEKIIRSFCQNDIPGQRPVSFELALVVFTSHGSRCASLVQRSGWTRDVNMFLQWLLYPPIPFGGGGFNQAAIAEGLAEALMMFAPNGSQTQQNVEVKKHCILVSASNPYPCPTPIYRPKFQSTENQNAEAGFERSFAVAETIAKSYSQGFVSLSVICPKQFPKLRTIFNAGKRNARSPDPPVDNKNVHTLVLVSENFMEARAALSRSGVSSLPSTQSPVNMGIAQTNSVSGPPPASVPAGVTSMTGSGTGTAQVAQNLGLGSFATETSNISGSSSLRMPQATGNLQVPASMAQTVQRMSQGNLSGPQMVGMNQNIMNGLGPAGSSTGNWSMTPTPGMTQRWMQSIVGGNNLGARPLSQQSPSALQTLPPKYVKFWEGNLAGLRQGESFPITRLEGYRSASTSKTLAENWPPTMHIVRLISRKDMYNKLKFSVMDIGKADHLFFKPMQLHGFLRKMQENMLKLIQLPSQTLFLTHAVDVEKDHRLKGWLFPEVVSMTDTDFSNMNDLFNGDNYESWCQRVTTMLTEQGLIEHIHKSMRCPEDGLTKEMAYTYFMWEQEDQKAQEILLGEMAKEIRDEFDAYKATKELWDALFLRFGKCMTSKLCPVITTLDTYMKNNDMSVSEKVRNFLHLAKPLDTNEKLSEWDKILAIMRILPKSWAATKTWLAMTQSILDLETVLKVIEIEEARQMAESRTSSYSAPVARLVSMTTTDLSNMNDLLNGDNYKSWCQRLTTILTDQGLIEHICKSKRCPEAGLTKEVAYTHFSWEQEDQRAREILLGEMAKEIRDEFDAYKETKDLWDALFLRFDKCLVSQLHPLITTLDTCMKNNDLSVSEKVLNLLDMAKPLDTNGQFSEWDKIIAIMRILPESWAAIKTWLTMTLSILDLQTVLKVIKMKEARQMDESSIVSHSAPTAMPSSTTFIDLTDMNDLLNGDNYESWSRRVTTVLTDQKLIEHIRKSMSCPEVGLTKEVAYAYFRWEQDDQKAREILLGEMEKEIRDEFDAHKETKELWDALFLRFGKCLASQLRPLITTLDICMNNKDLSVSEKVRNLLDMAKPLDMNEKLHEWDKILAIMRILPESWAATKTWLTMTLPILDLETVVKVIEMEEARQMDESDTASNSSPVARPKRKRNDET